VLSCGKNFIPFIVTFSFCLAVFVLSFGILNNIEGGPAKSSFQNFPFVSDSNLNVKLLFKGLKFPTSMAFLGPNDILVLEKNDGTVNRIVNGTMLPHPLLDANVSTESERGMLGIAVAKNMTRNKTYVFLSYTESLGRDATDTTEGKQPLGNRLYRYELVDNRLINPKLLLDLPASPGPTHNGGKIAIGPDNNVYIVIGIVGTTENTKTQTQNIREGLPPDGRGGILRVTQDGNVVPNGNILGDKIPLNIYYAYGIRNSFGLAFDPITKKLWDTENGPNYGDEINLVEPGFNSGWNKVQGIWEPVRGYAGNITLHPENLTDFGGKGKYSMPRLIWNQTAGPTAIAFLNSDKLGEKYENDMFVGDFNKGKIYDFKLNGSRTGLSLDGALEDRIANTSKELQRNILGERFGGITDLKVGPDGYLYVLSLHPGNQTSWYSADCDRKKSNASRVNCISFSNSSAQGSIFSISKQGDE
jgi:glucose/arabinose dehydrogenase